MSAIHAIACIASVFAAISASAKDKDKRCELELTQENISAVFKDGFDLEITYTQMLIPAGVDQSVFSTSFFSEAKASAQCSLTMNLDHPNSSKNKSLPKGATLKLGKSSGVVNIGNTLLIEFSSASTNNGTESLLSTEEVSATRCTIPLPKDESRTLKIGDLVLALSSRMEWKVPGPAIVKGIDCNYMTREKPSQAENTSKTKTNPVKSGNGTHKKTTRPADLQI